MSGRSQNIAQGLQSLTINVKLDLSSSHKNVVNAIKKLEKLHWMDASFEFYSYSMCSFDYTLQLGSTW